MIGRGFPTDSDTLCNWQFLEALATDPARDSAGRLDVPCVYSNARTATGRWLSAANAGFVLPAPIPEWLRSALLGSFSLEVVAAFNNPWYSMAFLYASGPSTSELEADNAIAVLKFQSTYPQFAIELGVGTDQAYSAPAPIVYPLEWIHLAITAEAAGGGTRTLRFFTNGQLVKTIEATPVPTGGQNAALGLCRIPDVTSGNVNGVIGGIRLSGRARTELEIADGFNRTMATYLRVPPVLPATSSPAEIVASMLELAGLELERPPAGASLYLGAMRDGAGIPDRAVFVLDSGGSANDRFLGGDRAIRDYSVTVRVRSSADDYAGGWALARAAHSALDHVDPQAAGYLDCRAEQPAPLYLSTDSHGRHVFGVNLALRYRGAI